MKPVIRIMFPMAVLMQLGLAQPTVAPASEPVGPARGDDLKDYNIVDSFETGYRFRVFGGSFDQYRSTVNYGDGIRLLSSFFTMNSKDGHGRYFDEIVLTTQGLGNDPYQNATLRISKNRLYRYDMHWRLNDYFNPGLVTDGGASQHLLDTEYTNQDHDLTLFPESNLKFFLGYSRGNQNGPAISTIQLFDARGNQFPLFENVRRLRNEYRLGNEFRLFGVRVNWMRGWEDFKEDSNYLSGPNAGNNPANPTDLTSFQRNEPIHGTSPYWRAALFTDRKYFSANGRFTYVSGRNAFVLNETAMGTALFGAANRQIITSGTAQRPALAGNLTLSFFPTSKLTIVNHTAVNNIRIDGNSVYAQFDNATQSLDYLQFEFLGIRTIANETDLNIQASPWLGLFGGFHYSDRLIRSIEQTNVQGSIFNAPSEQSNQLRSGVFGIRLRPVKPLSIIVSGELGRASRPLTPISERNYHALDARVRYKLKKVLFSASAQENYNVNSVSLSSYASHARTYSGDASWSPKDWFSLDASYSKLHLNTAGGIAYFASGQFFAGQQSIYVSNLHVANLTAHFDIRKRADLFVGYSHTQDTGDGRPLMPFPANIVPINQPLPPTAFYSAQTYPLRFLSPMGRLSIRINQKLRWNVGYQYYGYNADFYANLDYHAHTGYTSLLWSF
jgi:hypothetical protein